MQWSTARKRTSRRVLVHGLIYFGAMFAELMNGDGWEFRYYPDAGLRNFAAMAGELRACDVAYQIGGRLSMGKFLRAAKILRKNSVIMHWVGSDTVDQQQELAQGRAHPWVLQRVRHWAESDWMVREVEILGLPCELVPLPSARVPARPSPLPAEFSVLVYVPMVSRGELYGLDRILHVARCLPHIPFELVGLYEGEIPNPPANLKIHGRISDLIEFYRRASIVWRPVRHDGLSFMVMEALGHGRHVLWSYPFPGCIHVTNAEQAREEIERLHALHQAQRLSVNCAGVRAIAEGGYLPQHLKQRIHARLEELLDSPS
jgi:glycosyltransferase involved in cell wall biosynthesis